TRVGATGSLGGGAWVHSDAESATAVGEALLDRRARPRAGRPNPRIASGAIEQAAHNWLDGALGMHSSVEACDYDARTRPGLSIDWGESLKSAADKDVKEVFKP
ncbi:MAG: hypothetical protein ABIH03_05300, partial [Pseudomonadota bacterium]